MRRALLVLGLSAIAACSPSERATPASTLAETPRAVVPPPAKAVPVKLDFIEDDYPRALAEAKKSKRPLFIDVWAAWCHTCLSMRAYVFPDEAIRKRAGDFVWASIDVENEKNAEFARRFSSSVMPTLWVIDAEAEKPVVKWGGSLTTPELLSLLDDAALAARQGGTGGEAAAALVRGNHATGAGHADEAIAAYRLALATAPASWPKRAVVVDALTARLSEQKAYGECVAVASTEIPRLPPGTNLANVALAGLTCAAELPEKDPGRAKRAELAREVRRIATDMSQPILADDRSSLFEAVVEALEHDDPAAARDAARTWAAFLEGEAARATSPEAREVFDAHRLQAYIALGSVEEKALPMLEQSAKDFPRDYNHPARLARAYYELHRYPQALEAIDRAIGLGYGPRMLRLYGLKADILHATGDRVGEKKTLQASLDFAKTLPATARYAKVMASLEKRLADLR